MAVAKSLLRAEEFFLLPGNRYAELVDGEVFEYMPLGGTHGDIASTLNALLWNWNKQAGLGRIGG